jgi:hypothetical protein
MRMLSASAPSLNQQSMDANWQADTILDLFNVLTGLRHNLAQVRRGDPYALGFQQWVNSFRVWVVPMTLKERVCFE